MPEPSCGEVWLVDLNPTHGHEQAGGRPGLVVSVDLFNHGPAGRVVLLPLTGVAKGIPLHVEVNPPEGGVKAKSFIECEDVRSVAKDHSGRPPVNYRDTNPLIKRFVKSWRDSSSQAWDDPALDMYDHD